MNIHRTVKTGCEHMIKHFRESYLGAGFKIQVIEKCSGNGCSNNKTCSTAIAKRVNRADHWIKEVSTVNSRYLELSRDQ